LQSTRQRFHGPPGPFRERNSGGLPGYINEGSPFWTTFELWQSV
jgi:hypothetical protein